MIRKILVWGIALTISTSISAGMTYGADAADMQTGVQVVSETGAVQDQAASTVEQKSEESQSAEPDSGASSTEAETESLPALHIAVGEDPKRDGDAPFIEQDRVYVSLRSLADAFHSEIGWNAPYVSMRTALGDRLQFTVNDPSIMLNGEPYVLDVAPIMKNDRIFLPLRHAAEFMHAEAEWDAGSKTAVITQIPVYTVQEGDTLRGIAAQFHVQAGMLKERNGLESNALVAGATLRVVIPQAMKDKLPSPELLLLARIIDAEAGDESFEGQVAVGNVILNRVESDLFPDTIEGVIYESGQFSPVSNGMLERTEPDEDALNAAEAVLDGEVLVPGALYFYNPHVSGSRFFDSLDTVANIGNHRFAK